MRLLFCFEHISVEMYANAYKWTSHMRLSNGHMSFSNLIYGNTTTIGPIVFIRLFDIFPCV